VQLHESAGRVQREGNAMTKVNLAFSIRGFFEQHLVSQRGLSGHIVLAYRDAMKLLLEFTSRRHRKICTNLTLEDLTADTIRRFLNYLEQVRHNSVPTRNVRLAAIHSFFQYLATVEPTSPLTLPIYTCGSIQTPRSPHSGIIGTL
jgi:site-specific recombinase XerD